MSPKDDHPPNKPQKTNLERDYLRNVKLQQANRMRKRIQEVEKTRPPNPDTETLGNPNTKPNPNELREKRTGR